MEKNELAEGMLMAQLQLSERFSQPLSFAHHCSIAVAKGVFPQ